MVNGLRPIAPLPPAPAPAKRPAVPTNVPAAPIPNATTTATATSTTPPSRWLRAPSRSTSSTPKPAAAQTTACQGSRASSSAAGTAKTASSGTPAAAGAPASTAAPYTATSTAPNATVTRNRISGVAGTGAMPVAICVPAPADSAAKRANAVGPGRRRVREAGGEQHEQPEALARDDGQRAEAVQRQPERHDDERGERRVAEPRRSPG